MKSWPKVKLGKVQVCSNIAQNHSYSTYGSVTIRVSKTMSELAKFTINKIYIISLLSINSIFSEYHPDDFVYKSLKAFS